MERLTTQQRLAFMNYNKNISFFHFKGSLPLGRTFNVIRHCTTRARRSHKRKQIEHSQKYRSVDLQNTWRNLT